MTQKQRLSITKQSYVPILNSLSRVVPFIYKGDDPNTFYINGQVFSNMNNITSSKDIALLYQLFSILDHYQIFYSIIPNNVKLISTRVIIKDGKSIPADTSVNASGKSLIENILVCLFSLHCKERMLDIFGKNGKKIPESLSYRICEEDKRKNFTLTEDTLSSSLAQEITEALGSGVFSFVSFMGELEKEIGRMEEKDKDAPEVFMITEKGKA